MKLSLRDKIARPMGDFWHPDPEKDVNAPLTRRPPLPGTPQAAPKQPVQPMNPTTFEQRQKAVQPIREQKMDNGNIMKFFQNWYEIWTPQGKMIHTTKKASSKERMEKLASIIKADKGK